MPRGRSLHLAPCWLPDPHQFFFFFSFFSAAKHDSDVLTLMSEDEAVEGGREVDAPPTIHAKCATGKEKATQGIVTSSDLVKKPRTGSALLHRNILKL